MKNYQTVEITVEKEFTVDFIKNRKGGKPIARIEGMVALIDRRDKSFVAPGSSWIVSVVEVKDTCLIIEPLTEVRTAKENFDLLDEKINDLGEHFNKREPEHKKEKKNFKYKSKNEILKNKK